MCHAPKYPIAFKIPRVSYLTFSTVVFPDRPRGLDTNWPYGGLSVISAWVACTVAGYRCSLLLRRSDRSEGLQGVIYILPYGTLLRGPYLCRFQDWGKVSRLIVALCNGGGGAVQKSDKQACVIYG